MPKVKLPFNLPAIVILFILALALFAVGLYRLTFDADIVGSLPVDDPVISDARTIIGRHPLQDQMVIDVQHQGVNPDILVQGAEFVEKRLKDSGLFQQVGMGDIQHLGPGLIQGVAQNLPVLFSARELNRHVEPLLEPRRLRSKLADNFAHLLNLDSIGQAELISKDPLGLRNLILAKLAHLAPAHNARIVNGHLVSADNRHLLIVAKPAASGTDTTLARQVTGLMQTLAEDLNRAYADKGFVFTLTPFGAYRAALDNENIARRDIRKLILFATVGIAALLMLAFPRPYIGLFSLLPAVAGTLSAFFVFSLWHSSISILTIGFGGAIISITVDHGIAYLLFLDRSFQTTGSAAAKEVWSVGLLATLTTVGAFATLSFSGFPILAQIGQFAAIGIACSFLFVHTVFPKIFPTMPPASKEKRRYLRPLLKKLAHGGGKYKAMAAIAFGLLMMPFAKPEFNVDFRSMNTVGRDTAAAEQRIAAVWGNIFSRIFLMTEGGSLQEIQQKSDQLSGLLQEELDGGTLAAAFSPSMIFPGQDRGRENFRAWQNFWNPIRKEMLKTALQEASAKWGFTADAFDPFLRMVDREKYRPVDIPPKFFPLLGIQQDNSGAGPIWYQFSTLQPGHDYRAETFFRKVAGLGTAKVFDPAFFSMKLGEYLAATFLQMVMIVGGSVAVLVVLFFFEWRLAAVALLPVAFAFCSTLGTLRLLGHPLDIPGLMLSIIVLGMGIDYSLFFIRGYQRYRDAAHPSLDLIRMAVFLAAASTLIGFGALNFADHRLLKSAGLTCFLGIAYSLIGAFTILPPILRRIFAAAGPSSTQAPAADGGGHAAGVINRYRFAEAVPRLGAYFRVRRDPMFREPIPVPHPPRCIIDIGSGYGLPAAWLLEVYPQARIYALEPVPERARLSSIVVGERGEVVCSAAPNIPAAAAGADLAMMVDMLHYLDDQVFNATLRCLRRFLNPGGLLIIRVKVIGRGGFAGAGLIANLWHRLRNKTLYYRSAEQIQDLLHRAGFADITFKPCGSGRRGLCFYASRR